MNRHILIFVATFALGALIAVILRTAKHQPYAQANADHHEHSAPAAMTPPAPAAATTSAPEASVAPATMTTAATTASNPTAATDAIVNTTCAICGMPVDPALGTVTYKGKLIGFGCKTCPPKFKADPEKYGEAALKNQVAE